MAISGENTRETQGLVLLRGTNAVKEQSEKFKYCGE